MLSMACLFPFTYVTSVSNKKYSAHHLVPKTNDSLNGMKIIVNIREAGDIVELQSSNKEYKENAPLGIPHNPLSNMF